MINQLIINMKRTFYAVIALALSLTACQKTTKIEASIPAKIVDGAVVLETPAREPGQESALAMACDPIDTVRIALSESADAALLPSSATPTSMG